MFILLPVAWFCILLWTMKRMRLFQTVDIPLRAWRIAFAVKVVAGIALWALYTWYYSDRSTSDIYRYFDDASVMYNALHKHPLHYLKMLTGIGGTDTDVQPYYDHMNNWYKGFNHNLYNDNRTIIRFNALVMLVSFGYYHVHNVIINFVSLCGLVAVYKTFAADMPGRRWMLASVLVVIPSVLFWGSGVLKEGLVIFALGMLIWHGRKLAVREGRIGSVMMVLAMIVLLVVSKVYVLLAVVPALIAYVIATVRTNSRVWLVYVCVLGVMTIAFANLGRVWPDYDLVTTIQGKQDDFFHMLEVEQAGSAIDLPVLEPTFTSLVRHTPRAWMNTLLWPFPWEIHTPLMWVTLFENILILLFAVAAFIWHEKPDRGRQNIIGFCLCYSMTLLALIGLVTPVLGAIARYKIPAMPFFLILFLCIIAPAKLAARFRSQVD